MHTTTRVSVGSINDNDNFIKNATNMRNKSKTTQKWKDTKYKIGKKYND